MLSIQRRWKHCCGRGWPLRLWWRLCRWQGARGNPAGEPSWRISRCHRQGFRQNHLELGWWAGEIQTYWFIDFHLARREMWCIMDQNCWVGIYKWFMATWSHIATKNYLKSLLVSSSDCYLDLFLIQQKWKQILRWQCCLFDIWVRKHHVKANQRVSYCTRSVKSSLKHFFKPL